MNISVEGGTRKQKILAHDALLVSCYSLLSNRLFVNIDCNIHIHKPKNLYGSCTWDDTNIRPREFIIEIHREMDEKNFITTVCHEAVHLKQYVKNELRELYRGGHRLMWYDTDCSDLPYSKLPWEIEATSLEKSLYKNFINYQKNC